MNGKSISSSVRMRYVCKRVFENAKFGEMCCEAKATLLKSTTSHAYAWGPQRFIDCMYTQRLSGSAANEWQTARPPCHMNQFVVRWYRGLRQSCDIIKSFAADLLDFLVWFIWIALVLFSPNLSCRVHSSVSWSIYFSFRRSTYSVRAVCSRLPFVSAKLTFIACSLFQVALFCMRSLAKRVFRMLSVFA